MSQTTVAAPADPALPAPIVSSAPSITSGTELRIGGMTCGACAARIERILNGLGGVSATVSYAAGTATVEHPPSVTPEVLGAVVEDAGYTAAPVLPGSDDSPASHRARSLAGPAVSVPVLLAVAAGVFWFAGGHGLGLSILLAVATLVVTGPVVVAVPFVARTVAERRAVPVRALSVVETVVADGVEADDALAVAGALSSGSPSAAEPMAVAIAGHAAQHAAFWPAMFDIVALEEHGAAGETGARSALIGSISLLRRRGIVLPDALGAAADTAEAAHRTAVAVAWDGVTRAVLVLDRAA